MNSMFWIPCIIEECLGHHSQRMHARSHHVHNKPHCWPIPESTGSGATWNIRSYTRWRPLDDSNRALFGGECMYMPTLPGPINLFECQSWLWLLIRYNAVWHRSAPRIFSCTRNASVFSRARIRWNICRWSTIEINEHSIFIISHSIRILLVFCALAFLIQLYGALYSLLPTAFRIYALFVQTSLISLLWWANRAAFKVWKQKSLTILLKDKMHKSPFWFVLGCECASHRAPSTAVKFHIPV